MRIPVAVWQGPAAALLAVVLAADPVQAQAPGAPNAPGTTDLYTRLGVTPGPRALIAAAGVGAGVSPGSPSSTTYPYWASAPMSFAPSRVTIPVPAPSAFTISNAASSPPTQSRMGVGAPGGFVPPFLTVRDVALDNKAHIWLRVPRNAEIWVNGVKTKQTGESRYFFSPPLTPGQKYSYQMRLRWMKDGKPVEETQRIPIQAGQTVRRDFTQSR